MEQESLGSASDNIRKEYTATYNIFAQDELDILKGPTGMAGLRYTYNNSFGSQLTPNVALFYLSLRQFTLTPGVGIENIFNKRDTSYWNSNFSTVSPGRSFYVSVALKYNDR